MRQTPAIAVLAAALLAAAMPAAANEVLMVIGIEYSCYPDHYCVSGIDSSLDEFAWQGEPIPPYTQRAADILALNQKGTDPLWWVAHPNMRDFYHVPEQINDLLGVISATGNTWYPDAIALVNTWIAPPPWRNQVAIEMANPYAQQVPVNRIPAFVLEPDFHSWPSIWNEECGAPYTVAWVPANWHSLPPLEAMEEVFRAIRERRALGTVGPARFSSLEIVDSNMTLTLTEPIEHVQLWAGGSEPVSVWENTASATFDLSALTGSEHFVHWFAYGDSVAGNWDTWSCHEKEIFFTSPIVRSGPTFVNQYAAVELQGRIPIKVLLHQHTSLSPDGDLDFTFQDLFNDCAQLGIDCVLTNDHHPPDFREPLPDFVAVWDVVPPLVITASAGTGGSINPSGEVEVLRGAQQTFTITPAPCHQIADVLVDGRSVGAVTSYTFTSVAFDHTISANFAVDTFTMSTSVIGDGSLMMVPNQPIYDCSTSVEITAVPGTGWQFNHWTGDVSGNDNPVTVLMDGNKTITAVFMDSAAPEVLLTSPNGGEVREVGSTHGITWTATDNTGVTGIDLEYSLDGGTSYPFVIGTALPNTGSFDWLIPDSPTQIARVRVTAHDAALHAASDESDADFVIRLVDNTPPEVLLTSPNGGEVWEVGSTHGITWAATDNTGVTGIDLKYSADGGTTYPFVIGTGLPNTGSYDWLVPDSPTQIARVRVTAHDAALHATNDESDADFEIHRDVAMVPEVLLADSEIMWVYPNPAVGGNAHVVFRNPGATLLDVIIYDSSGRMVRRLQEGSFAGDTRTMSWDGKDASGRSVSPGLYFVRFIAGSEVRATKRIVLLR